MPTRPCLRSTGMATTSLVLLTLSSGIAFAAPIDLGNDVDVAWQNELFCAEQAQDFPELCSIPVFGAPRLVPDARNSGSSLKILVDFIESEVAGLSTLVLNVGDSLLNQILLPGTSTPLTLTYEFDFNTVDPLNLTLADFQNADPQNFSLLPAGDLVFTVGGRFDLRNPGGDPFDPTRKEPGATITLSGAGTALSVPEPGVLSLLLWGLAGAALGTTRRRRSGGGVL